MSNARMARWRERLREQGKKAMTIYLYPEDEQRIKDIAHAWHCSTSDVVINAMAQYDPGDPLTLASVTASSQERHESDMIEGQVVTILQRDLPGLVRAIIEEYRQEWPGTRVPEPTYDPMPAPAQKNRGGRSTGALNQAILVLLADHPDGLTAEEIRVHVHATQQTGDTLAGMVRRGKLSAHGTGKQKHYRLPAARSTS